MSAQTATDPACPFAAFAAAVERSTPAGAVILIASHGDESLLRVNDRRSVHFPSDDHGSYLGYHPSDGFEATQLLRAAIARTGATFLVIPSPQLWWLEHYHDLRRELEHVHECAHRDEWATIYRLRAAPTRRVAQPLDPHAPLIIGGVGGSGTRVVADVLMRQGAHLGTELNHAWDNLLFAQLFKRLRWWDRTGDPRTDLNAFAKILLGQTLADDEKNRVVDAYTPDAESRAAAEAQVEAILAHEAAVDRSTCAAWGWKVPPAHLMLEPLVAHFPGARYIHVMRHGVDMAFSSNQTQLRQYGKLLGVDLPASPDRLPAASLQFWIEANRRAIELAPRLLGHSRFLLINFDQMCADPASAVRRLIDFAELPATDEQLRRCCDAIRVPASTGRYRNHDLAQFSPPQLDAVRALGFEVLPHADPAAAP
jgi:Sulfotransferase family